MAKRDHESDRRRRSPQSSSKSRRSRSRSRSPYSSRRDHYSSRRRSRSRERRNQNPKGKFKYILDFFFLIYNRFFCKLNLVEDIVGIPVNMANFDKEEQQKKLEIVMQQRREKVEKWRLEQANKRKNELFENVQEKPTITEDESKKKWTLENDSDENDSDECDLKHDAIDVDDSQLKLPAKRKKEDEIEAPFTNSKFNLIFKWCSIFYPMV